MKIKSVGFRRNPSKTEGKISGFAKERKEHPSFTKAQVAQIIKDHAKAEKKIPLDLWIPEAGANVSIFNKEANIEDSEFATLPELKKSVKYWKEQGYDVSKIEMRIKREPKVIKDALAESLGSGD